jgi:hypothetical protein
LCLYLAGMSLPKLIHSYLYCLFLLFFFTCRFFILAQRDSTWRVFLQLTHVFVSSMAPRINLGCDDIDSLSSHSLRNTQNIFSLYVQLVTF